MLKPFIHFQLNGMQRAEWNRIHVLLYYTTITIPYKTLFSLHFSINRQYDNKVQNRVNVEN